MNEDLRRLQDVVLANDPYHTPTTMLGALIHKPARHFQPGISWDGGGRGRRSHGGGPVVGGATAGHGGVSRGDPVRQHAGTEGSGGLPGFLADMTSWLVTHVPPLPWLLRVGVKLSDTGRNWRVNAPLALVGAVAVFPLIGGPGATWPGVAGVVAGVAGEHASLVTLVFGLVSGWYLVPIAGVLLSLAVMLTGMALTLMVCWGVLWFGWRLLTSS